MEFGYRSLESHVGRIPNTPATVNFLQTGAIVTPLYTSVSALPQAPADGTHADVTNGVTVTAYAYTRATGWVAL